jgi:hypothetical protein
MPISAATNTMAQGRIIHIPAVGSAFGPPADARKNTGKRR